MSEIFSLLKEQLAHTDAIQWAVLVLGVTEVLLARVNNILLYPVGIVATALAIFSLFNAQLYAECLLHLYYIVMSIYGWWYWHGKSDGAVRVMFASRSDWVVTLGIVFGGWGFLYYVLITFTDSTVPLWDAWISSTAWAGMWLLSRRKIENWILLNVSNIFAIPLLFKKQLPLFALLTIFLFIVACNGYLKWVALYRKSLSPQFRHDEAGQHQ